MTHSTTNRHTIWQVIHANCEARVNGVQNICVGESFWDFDRETEIICMRMGLV